MHGKVAMVTGGSRGVGRACVEALLESGAKVCFVALNQTLGTEVEAELQKRHGAERTFFRRCDVTREDDLADVYKEVVDRYGHLDVLCNNAGIVDEQNWSRMVDINMMAMLRGTDMALKYMGKAAGRKHGAIVNVASGAGLIPYSIFPHYVATKHAVVGYTRSIGEKSLERHGVAINCLCLTKTDTDMVQESIASVSKEDPAAGQFIIDDPDGCLQPAEVAECFMSLLKHEDVSGKAMLVTQKAKKILNHHSTISDITKVF